MAYPRARLNYSPRAIDDFSGCNLRFWFSKHDDGAELSPVDETPQRVGRAAHESLLEFQRNIVQNIPNGRLPGPEHAVKWAGSYLTQRWARQGLASEDGADARLESLSPGFAGAARLVVDETPGWVFDRAQRLVWVERILDHGPYGSAVKLADDAESPTRADLVGIRQEGRRPRIVIRDYKTAKQVVEPEKNTGLLVRAMWAFSELVSPRAGWFLAKRGVEVAKDVVDVETVNLRHAETEHFVLRQELGARDLLTERNRVLTVMEQMWVTEHENDPAQVIASPSGLCRAWCKHLRRCAAGQRFVREQAERRQAAD